MTVVCWVGEPPCCSIAVPHLNVEDSPSSSRPSKQLPMHHIMKKDRRTLSFVCCVCLYVVCVFVFVCFCMLFVFVRCCVMKFVFIIAFFFANFKNFLVLYVVLMFILFVFHHGYLLFDVDVNLFFRACVFVLYIVFCISVFLH